MNIRKAIPTDAEALKVLYFEHLTKYPPTEEQDMSLWKKMLDKFEKDENMYLLVLEEDNQVVSSVQMAIIESLTHNVRPFAVIENVVTHADYRNKGYASRLRSRVAYDEGNTVRRRCHPIVLSEDNGRQDRCGSQKRRVQKGTGASNALL